ncbi:hypothetical protein JCM19239_2120 [Vibrio variabilis]|uniref:Uncharacterized protein n=1 Tax=Vibrio variabilis TaxID=990271 RepID=A0ABQ0JJE7_9VIBR|nr:hypothetical protein JCM19239_2120 [Vibrio variabilis]
MNQALAKALKRLVDAYPDSVAASTLTLSQKRQLEDFNRTSQGIQIIPKGAVLFIAS